FVRAAQCFGQYFSDDDRVGGSPWPRFIFQYLELDRYRFGIERIDICINAKRVIFKCGTKFRAEMLQTFLPDLRKSVSSPLLVFFKCCFPKYLRGFATSDASKKVHLPQTIACRNVALNKIKSGIIFARDVRYRSIIADDRSIGAESV